MNVILIETLKNVQGQWVKSLPIKSQTIGMHGLVCFFFLTTVTLSISRQV